MSSDVISLSEWQEFTAAVANIWSGCFNFLGSFRIAGISLLQILLSILGLSLFFVIIHNLAMR